MEGIETLKEKLKKYLSTLSDNAQSLLLRSLEKGKRSGDCDASAELILTALKELMQIEEKRVSLEKVVRNEFFRDARYFVADADLVNKTEARISPSSIEKIWSWIKRDIATAAVLEQLEQDCSDIDEKEMKRRADVLRADLVMSINKYLQRIKSNFAGEQKVSNQLGGELVYKDLVDVLDSSQKLKPIKPILSRISKEVSSWSSTEGEEAYGLVSRYVQQMPMKASWVFSALSKRLASPRLRVELATRLSGSDDAVQISATVYAPAIHQVLADMQARSSLFCSTIKGFASLEVSLEHLNVWGKLAKAAEVEMEVPAQCAWGKTIAAMKSELSELLEQEIEPAPGLVRKALRAPKSGAREHADQNLIADAIRAVTIFHHTERLKDRLALNGPVTNVRKELDQSFEILTTSLVERTRMARGEDIAVCRILSDTATEIAKFLFDEDYAKALRRQLRAATSAQEVKVAEA